MATKTKTIQIILPNGEPRGVRIAEFTTGAIRAVQVPWMKLKEVMGGDEINQIGIYLLFDESDEEVAKPPVYIGQTESFKKRFNSHKIELKSWTTAILLMSKTHAFTVAHIRYLEWLAIKVATEAGRYTLKNGNAGAKPFIPKPMEDDVLDAFETCHVLVSTLGFPIFDPPAGSGEPVDDKDIYFCSGSGWEARGRMVEDGFVVFKGSTARGEVASANQQFAANKRQSLLDSGVLVPDGKILRFTEDYPFKAPSGAAVVVQGRNANGWVEWRRKDGKTLDEVERSGDV